MMVDHEFIIDRPRVFKEAKYIIYATLEKADKQIKGGKAGKLRTTFKSLLGDMKKNNR